MSVRLSKNVSKPSRRGVPASGNKPKKFKFRKRRKNEYRKAYRKAYYKAYGKTRKAYYKAYGKTSKFKAILKTWRKANPARVRAYRSPEQNSVRHHRYAILSSKNPRNANYKGMPFFDGWNPKKGGSSKAGADWIIANLGKRPKGCSLHIIDHAKGFVPGNLEWASPQKQNNQRMFLIIAQLKHRIKELEAEVAQLKAA